MFNWTLGNSAKIRGKKGLAVKVPMKHNSASPTLYANRLVATRADLPMSICGEIERVKRKVRLHILQLCRAVAVVVDSADVDGMERSQNPSALVGGSSIQKRSQTRMARATTARTNVMTPNLPSPIANPPRRFEPT